MSDKTLSELLDDQHVIGYHEGYAAASDEFRKNAERYRWLRDSGQAVSTWLDLDGVHWAIDNVLASNLDDAVDAAFAAAESEDK